MYTSFPRHHIAFVKLWLPLLRDMSARHGKFVTRYLPASFCLLPAQSLHLLPVLAIMLSMPLSQPPSALALHVAHYAFCCFGALLNIF